MNTLLLILLSAFTVVIDAGHGGKDPGAVGRIAREKDLNLEVSLMLGKMISDAYDSSDVKVVYTRTTDVFLPLQERADIVNKNNADLFICIHTNSAENRNVRGAETFVLGTEKMDRNLDVAMRENSVIKLEKDYQTAYQGFDPNSIDSYIMFELMQNNYMDRSLNYATLLQHQFSDSLHRADRGVRQAAFWVLLKSACPSVLVEMGFISNADEERYLASTKGKEEIARALFRSFQTFCKRQHKQVITSPKDDNQPEAITSPKDDNQPQAPQYAVQLFVSRTVLPAGDPNFCGLKDYHYFEKNGLYKYYTAASADRAEVAQEMKKLRAKFKDCFIIKLP